MKLSGGDRKQTILAGVLGVAALIACIFIYEEVSGVFGGSSTPSAARAPVEAPTPAEGTSRAVDDTAGTEPTPTPAAVAGTPAKPVGTVSSALDPTLHMEAMLVSEQVEYAGNGRNIFSPNSAPPVVIQKPIAPARNVAVNTPPPQPQGPPPPPPIDLKFFGFVSANGKPEAFLLHNDEVYVAFAGDVVLRRYRVIAIDTKTIQVEDLQNNNRQTLPLLAN